MKSFFKAKVQHRVQEASVHLISVQITEIKVQYYSVRKTTYPCDLSNNKIIISLLNKGVFTRNIIYQNLFRRKMQMCNAFDY